MPRKSKKEKQEKRAIALALEHYHPPAPLEVGQKEIREPKKYMLSEINGRKGKNTNQPSSPLLVSLVNSESEWSKGVRIVWSSPHV